MSKKQILDYRLELEDVKENELPEKDKDKILSQYALGKKDAEKKMAELKTFLHL